MRILGARYLVEMDLQTETDSGIVIANSDSKLDDGIRKCRIVEVGESGTIKKGSVVLCERFAGIPVEIEAGKAQMIVDHADIVAVVE